METEPNTFSLSVGYLCLGTHSSTERFARLVAQTIIVLRFERSRRREKEQEKKRPFRMRETSVGPDECTSARRAGLPRGVRQIADNKQRPLLSYS